MEDCVFCRIIAREIPSKKIYENEHVFAFLDILPTSKGHTLVIPKKHYQDIFDIDEGALKEVMSVGKKLAIVLRNSLGAVAMNVTNNNGAHAGQIVSHFHLHLIPRYSDDGIVMYGPRTHEKAQDHELEEIAEKIRNNT